MCGSKASKCRRFTQREGGVDLALGREPVIELMTGIEAALLRVVVRCLGDHGLASIGFDVGVTAGDAMRFVTRLFVGVELRTGECM